MPQTATRSELQLETELDIARRAGASNHTGAAGSHGYARGAEVRMVEHVEKLSPEFEIHLLGNRISFNK